MAGGTETATLIASLVDKVSAPAKAISNALRGIGRAGKDADGSPVKTLTERLNGQLEATNKRLDVMRGRMLGAVGGAYVLGRALASPIEAAMAFESAMADVAKVVDFGGAEGLSRFKTDLLALSRTLPVAVDGLANIAAAAGQAGIAGDELLKFTEGAAKIATAFDIPASEAGDDLAKLRTGLGAATDDVFSLADAINQLSNEQASSAADVLNFTTRVGAMAKMFGFTAEQASAFGSAMIASGAAPEVAATSFLNMGRALTKGTAATKAQGEAFAKLGLEATDVAARMQKDAIGTTTDVLNHLAALPKEQQAAVSTMLFGEEARALGPLLTNLKLVSDSLAIVSDRANYAGSSTREYEARSKTTANALQLFQNRIQGLSIAIGNALLPALNSILATAGPIVDRVADLAGRFPRLTIAVVSTTAGLIGLRIASIAAGYGLASLKAGALTAALGLVRVGAGAKALAALSAAPFIAYGQHAAGAFQIVGMRFRMMTAAFKAGETGIVGVLQGIGTTGVRALLSLLNPIALVRGAITLLKVALVSSGIGAILVAIGLAGAWIYQNWSGITEMFKAFGAALVESLGPARGYIEPIVDWIGRAVDILGKLTGEVDASGDSWRAFGKGAGESVAGAINWVTELPSRITASLSGMAEALYSTGTAAIQGLWDGMVAKFAELITWVKDIPSRIVSAIGNIDLSGMIKWPSLPSWAGGTAAAQTAPQGSRRIPGVGNVAIPIDGARAGGGPVETGGAYVVGEEGPEIFRPRSSGTIIPNGTATAAIGAGPAPTVAPRVNMRTIIQVNGPSDPEAVAQRVVAIIDRKYRDAVGGLYGDYGLDTA